MYIRLFSFLILFLFCISESKAQVLPADRQVDWTLAGLKDTTTNNFPIVDLIDFGIIGDGLRPNDDVLSTVLSLYDDMSGVIIKFPEGDFLFNQTISLPVSYTHLTLPTICSV